MGTYRRKHPHCQTCVYRASTDDPHGCDFVHFTDTTRTHFLGTGDALDPDNCTLYKKGDRLVKPKPLPALRRIRREDRGSHYWSAISAIQMFQEGATTKAVARELNITIGAARQLRKAYKYGKMPSGYD